VRTAVADLPERAMVVIRQVSPDGPRHWAIDAGSVRLLVDGGDPQALLGAVLDLDSLPPSRTVELDDPDAVPRPGDVLVRAGQLLGVVRHSGDGNRGAAMAPPPAPPAAEAEPTTGAEPPAAEPTTGAEPPAAEPATARFRAFPALESPDQVRECERFTLVAKFSSQPPDPDPAAQPIIVAGAPPQLTFVVQVGGFGFSFPDGIRRELTVTRDSPEGPTAEFTVVAGDVKVRATRTLEVSFEYAGEVCGMAWRDVEVIALQEPASPEPPPASSGGTGVAMGVDTAPGLTVTIRSEPGAAQLEWLFHPRQDIPRPSERITTTLEAPSAEAFAVQLMAQLPAAKDAVSLPLTVRGMGKLINRVIPDEFWAMVEATWQATPAGETPSLLLTTSEPFVPWELAWVDDEVIDPALLPQGLSEAPLGSLWRVGRWVPPVRRRRGPDRPAVPPAARVEADAVAVVIGDYAADTKIRSLPHAVEEGRAIAVRYRGLPLTVSEGDVDRLMNATLERDGTGYAPTVVHFASHGQVSLQQPQYTGILLSGGRRLDLLTVEGSRLGESSAPFVFLNACQVGTAGTVLSTYGGLAGAFLGTGCRGFLAPLWNVDDEVAKSIALDFYELTLNKGVPVGEAVRQIRAGFGTGQAGTATPLAYVFYGHPDLQLSRPGPATPASPAAPATPAQPEPGGGP
ncbi:MAG TPA: CHAT domain-containing protein, partial [Actinomycetota bacterium]|nr:CHAT domain-containing protein [Actinomycetota bacterium]